MATGASTEEEKGVNKRRSWSDVVSSSPPASSSPSVKTNKEVRVVAGMPKPSSTVNKKNGAGSSPGRESASPKIFSAEDVAKLVELARKHLRKEKEQNSGWKEVASSDLRNKEKTYARDLVDSYQGSPEEQFRCWQCDQPGHKSSDCPKGERCFVCNRQGHKRAECPSRRKAMREGKGKALALSGESQPRHRPAGGIFIGDQRPVERKGAKPTRLH